jgi:uracil-DNA glycosylase family 4
MTDPPRTANGTHPKQKLERLARNLRLRLEGEGRAGLAAVGRIPETAPRAPEPAPRAPEPGAEDPGDASLEPLPEVRAAEAAKRELDAAVTARAPAPAAEAPPARQERAPAVHVKGPGLFDDSSPDLEDGVSKEEALERIVKEVAACRRCGELAAGRTNTVPGQGNPNARLMFIGEGPGADEDLQGMAFVGRAGQLLTKMVAAIDMTRDEVFIANIVKCRPPGNRRPGPEECANCAPYLARQIEIIRPKVIVALGGTAAQYLLQTHDGITRLRGRFYPYMGAKLMPTFHPAYVLRNYVTDTRKKVYNDLKMARAELDA